MMRENNDLLNSGGEEVDIRTEFGDLLNQIDAASDVPLPESLSAEALFMRFEGLLDETEPEESGPVEDGNNTAGDPPAVITLDPGKKARGLNFYMPRILAAAACFVVGFVGLRYLGDNNIKGDNVVVEPEASSGIMQKMDAPVPTAGSGEIAGDYGELRQVIYDIQKEQGYYYTYATTTEEYAVDDMVEEPMEAPAPDMAMNPATAGGGSSSSALMGGMDAGREMEATGGGNMNGKNVYNTNTQEKGIDEADIIKTDGTYLYVYRNNSKNGQNEIAIVQASNLKHMSTIDLGGYAYDGSLYLDGDYMVLVRTLSDTSDITYGEKARTTAGSLAAAVLDGKSESASSGAVSSSESRVAGDMAVAPSMPGYHYGGYADVVEVVTFDISDKKEPEQISRHIQDGNYLTSRYMGGVVYTITTKGVWEQVIDNNMPVARFVPTAGTGNTLELLPAGDVVVSPYLASPNYVTVSATDIRTGDRATQAVLGVADTVYMSYNAIYLTATTYDYSRTPADKNQTVSYDQTGIVKLEIDGVNLTYKGGVQVDGRTDSQFSFSEKDGYLRVATTANTQNSSINNLYVLDSGLKTVGTLTNLAPGETIYSVRYVGNMGYIVTFKQVDPLFAIDLSDPKNPQVVGELKIPGFSEYLHPIDENTLLGFGYNTTETQWGVTTDGLKLSLFDVSDPENPTETKSYPIGNSGSHSPALYNHKAFMYYPEKQIVGIPVSVYTASAAGYTDESFSGFLLFQVKKDGFELYGQIASREAGDEGFGRGNVQYAIQRGVYIGDVIYTFSDGCIMSHRLRSGMPKTGEYLFDA